MHPKQDEDVLHDVPDRIEDALRNRKPAKSVFIPGDTQ